jgi:hypothetical protein
VIFKILINRVKRFDYYGKVTVVERSETKKGGNVEHKNREKIHQGGSVRIQFILLLLEPLRH